MEIGIVETTIMEQDKFLKAIEFASLPPLRALKEGNSKPCKIMNKMILKYIIFLLGLKMKRVP